MLSHKKHERLLKELPAQAVKVYNAVPISEPWTINKIATELNRLLMPMEFKSVEFWLRKLDEAGLVYCNKRSEFVRVAVREPAIDKIIEETTVTTPSAQQPKPHTSTLTPIDRLRGVATRLMDFAEELEDAITALEAEQKATDDQIEKFKKLGALLKELS